MRWGGDHMAHRHQLPYLTPHDCNHSELTHHYCRTLGHLIQTEGPTRLLLHLGALWALAEASRLLQTKDPDVQTSAAVNIITLKVVWSCTPPFIFTWCSSLSAFLWSWANETRPQHGNYRWTEVIDGSQQKFSIGQQSAGSFGGYRFAERCLVCVYFRYVEAQPGRFTPNVMD